MAQYVAIGTTGAAITPLVYRPYVGTPRFVRLADGLSQAVPLSPLSVSVEELDAVVEAVDALTEAVPISPLSVAAIEPEAVVEAIVDEPETIVETAVTSSEQDVIAEPAPVKTEPAVNFVKHTPISINLLTIRRILGLTPEEFARPIIEDGEGLINRLEAGFSRASSEVARLICDTWSICPDYLYRGTGPMFEYQSATLPADYAAGLVGLVKTYLSVATIDTRGRQYWKGSLVGDLLRLIDVGKLDARGMARVVRVMFDFLDVDQYCEMLERMTR